MRGDPIVSGEIAAGNQFDAFNDTIAERTVGRASLAICRFAFFVLRSNDARRTSNGER